MANEPIYGLLGNPFVQLGTGLLAASGPSATPKSFGQVLGEGMQFASERQMNQMQTQAAREQLLQQSRQRNAMNELMSMFGPQVAGQPNMMQLGAEAFPQQFGQAMANQMFAQPEQARVSTDLSTFAALNPELQIGTPEFRESYLEFVNQQDGSEQALTQADLILKALQIEATENEIAAANRSAEQEQAETARSVISGLDRLADLADINDRLRGTFLESGKTAPDLRRMSASVYGELLGGLGYDASEIQEEVALFDTFKKDSANLALDALTRLAASQSITNQQFGTIVAGSANIGISPDANQKIIGDQIEALLAGADAAGIDVPDREFYEGLLNDLRGAEPADDAPGNLGSAPLPTGRIRFEDLPE